jgi:hypothetical protein
MPEVVPQNWTMISVEGRCFQRLPIRTRWLDENDDLASVMLEYAAPRQPGDTVIVSEKVALLLAGKAIRADTIRIGWEARLLARCVRPRPGSLGLSVPVKMQYVLGVQGRARMFGAAAASALTRPFGVKGVFYRLAGPLSRDIDGGRPPYEELIFPPFDAGEATALCEELAEKLVNGVAIADTNDFGGTIRAVSKDALPADVLARALADNPLRQRLAGTPIGIVRPVR